MNQPRLAKLVYEMGQALYDREVERAGAITAETADVSELLKVLSRVLQGKTVERAFGAPGDWGYGTEIGKAIAEV